MMLGMFQTHPQNAWRTDIVISMLCQARQSKHTIIWSVMLTMKECIIYDDIALQIPREAHFK